MQKFSKEDNYHAILKKIKEESTMKEKKNLKILRIAAVFLTVLILGVAAPQIYGKIKWNIEYKEYEQRKTTYGSASIQQAVEAGYAENIQMDYIYQDEIGVKINSLMITDDYFEMIVDIKLPEEIEVNTDTLSYGFAVYDENNNIYGVLERFHTGTNKVYNYNQKLYQELGLPKNTLPLFSSCGTGLVSAKKGNIIEKTKISSAKGFPKSKELYIRIFDIGYDITEMNKEKHKIIAAEDFQISDAEWNIKIDVPEKFYERKTVNLGIQNQIEGFEIEKFEATDTRTTLIAKIEGLEDLIWAGKDMESSEFSKALNESIYITDKDGKIYYQKDLGMVKETFKMFFDINTNGLDVDLFLNVKINGQLYTSQIILK